MSFAARVSKSPAQYGVVACLGSLQPESKLRTYDVSRASRSCARVAISARRTKLGEPLEICATSSRPLDRHRA
jgi:hypothetical protein